MNEAQQGLVDAGLAYPGALICESPAHGILMGLAQAHAKYMARARQQGHQGFDARFKKIYDKGLGSAVEICAESWKWQEDDTMLALGEEMFKCWEQSPGHWRVASTLHKWFGAGMAKGRNGIWYACIIGVKT